MTNKLNPNCDCTFPHLVTHGPGRCTECSLLVNLQGHRDCCSQTAPITPEETPYSYGEATRPWQPINLTNVLSGDWRPPTPTVGRRSDNIGIFYPGKMDTISSESEAGKTWLALVAAFQKNYKREQRRLLHRLRRRRRRWSGPLTRAAGQP